MKSNYKHIGFCLLLPLILLFSAPEIVFAQFFVNNGAKVIISNGSDLTLNSELINLSNGQFLNSGNITILDNWYNNGVSGNILTDTAGFVIFDGQTEQIIGGTNSTLFNKLKIQNDVLLTNGISISNKLIFSSGLLSLDTNNLFLEQGAVISGSSESGYVNAGNSGRLFMEVDTANVEFPIGTQTSFTPIILKNSGLSDYFGVRVFNDVLDEGLSGTTVSEIDHCVNNTWDITEQIPGGSNLTVTTYWNENNEGINFDRVHSGIGHFHLGSWNPQTEVAAEGNNPYFISRSGITELSAFAVGDTSSPMAIKLRLHLNITAFLEGAFNGSDMDTTLSEAGVIPLQQPFNTPPWNYQGTEYVDSVPNGVVDWVLTELRDASSPSSATSATTIAQKAAFLLNDGSIVDLDGSSFLTFDNSFSDSLFVVIRHRNHLGIMSASALVLSDGVYSYNFTTSNSQAFGTDGQKQLATNRWGMYGGNCNGNDTINSSDIQIWSQKAGKRGYFNADFNLNTQVNNPDKNDISVENMGKVSKVPQ